MGGKCCICGYNKCNKSLALHHLDPSEKEFSISDCTTRPKSWIKIVAELKKCVLVCHNCHSEIHAGLTLVPDNAPKFNNDFEKYREKIEEKNCIDCNKKIQSTSKRCKDCYGYSTRKTERPTKEQLSKLVWMMPTTKVAKMFSMSDKAIEKWCKCLEVEKPPRGYWQKKMHS